MFGEYAQGPLGGLSPIPVAYFKRQPWSLYIRGIMRPVNTLLYSAQPTGTGVPSNDQHYEDRTGMALLWSDVRVLARLHSTSEVVPLMNIVRIIRGFRCRICKTGGYSWSELVQHFNDHHTGEKP